MTFTETRGLNTSKAKHGNGLGINALQPQAQLTIPVILQCTFVSSLQLETHMGI